MAKLGNKRSITIARHRTSISVEQPFWEALCGFAEKDRRSVADLIGEIDRRRSGGRGAEGAAGSLSAAIRLYVLDRVQRAKSE
jgi:predicted DNA-binding ribbon-helix-helix protein